MSALDLWPPTAGLGVAGLDPAGALLAVGALAAGARARHVATFGVFVLAGTTLLGTALSLTVGQKLAAVDWTVLIPAGRLGAALEIGLALLLLGWAGLRLARRSPAARKPTRSRTSLLPLLGLGVLFLGSAVLDPTFLGVVVLAGRGDALPVVLVAHVIWSLVSQLPLVVVLLVIWRGGHERAVAGFRTGWARVAPGLGRVATGAMLLAGAFLLVDGGWWFATGEFLVPGPQ